MNPPDTRFADTRDAVLAAARAAAADYLHRPDGNALGAVIAAVLTTMADRKPMGRWGADDLEELAAAVAGLSTGDAFAATDRARAADRGDLSDLIDGLRSTPVPTRVIVDDVLDAGYRRHRAIPPAQPAANGAAIVQDTGDLFRDQHRGGADA